MTYSLHNRFRLAQLLANRREEIGATIADVASRAGIGYAKAQKILAGGRTTPLEPALLARLAVALKLDAAELFAASGYDPSDPLAELEAEGFEPASPGSELPKSQKSRKARGDGPAAA